MLRRHQHINQELCCIKKGFARSLPNSRKIYINFIAGRITGKKVESSKEASIEHDSISLRAIYFCTLQTRASFFFVKHCFPHKVGKYLSYITIFVCVCVDYIDWSENSSGRKTFWGRILENEINLMDFFLPWHCCYQAFVLRARSLTHSIKSEESQ